MAEVTIERISLITYSSLLNNTVNNHGDHCIVAYSEREEVIQNDSNQTLLAGADKRCQSATDLALASLHEFAVQWFR